MKYKLLALIVTIGVLSPSAEVFAQGSTNSTIELLDQVVPNIASETGSETEISISELETSHSALISDEVGQNAQRKTSLEILSVATAQKLGSGLTSLRSIDDNNQFVVQPLVEGFRILNIIPDEKAIHRFSFRIHAPSGTKLVESLGSIRLELGDEILGIIRAPWAVDSNGTSVETHFDVQGFTVTQTIERSSDSVYPVIADPNWGYAFTYSQTNSPATSWNALHGCFNCYFPVSGAPTKWPSYGTILNLTSAGMNMQCMMSFVTTGTNLYRWKFNATSAHVDGYGSYITFELSKYPVSGKNRLIVDAFIVKDFALGNALYEAAANANWAKFAANLNGI